MEILFCYQRYLQTYEISLGGEGYSGGGTLGVHVIVYIKTF